MRIIILKNADEVGIKAADMVEAVVRKKPDAVLGLATGSSPLPLYRELIRRHREEGLDFSRVRTVNLDEYIGLSPEHNKSYCHFMRENLFNGLDMDLENTSIPRGDSEDPLKEAEKYERHLENVGRRDIQILGIGVNGHIAFNEPMNPLSSVTHVVDLTDETIESNSRFFKSRSEVPVKAITMGMKEIFNAERIVLISTGDSKKDITGEFLTPDITVDNPSSLLKLHPDVTIICDEKAGALLKGKVIDNGEE